MGAYDRHFPTTIYLVIALVSMGATLVLYPVFATKILCFALFALAFNLLGYAGLVSFGHAAFFGMGGYVAAYVAKVYGFTPEAALLAAMVGSAILGVCAGWISIRRSGIYFGMITLALAQMVYFFCLQAPFTGGEDGIQDVPRGALFGLVSLQSDYRMYAFVVVVFLLAVFLCFRTVYSPFGHILRSIRDNEQRAISLGYKVQEYKLLVFVLSATLSGLAGGMKALVFGVATLADVHFMTSGYVLLMTVVGGIGTLTGPLVGAMIFTGLDYYLASEGTWILIIQGLIFVTCVLTFRRGLIGEFAFRLKNAICNEQRPACNPSGRPHGSPGRLPFGIALETRPRQVFGRVRHNHRGRRHCGIGAGQSAFGQKQPQGFVDRGRPGHPARS
ncbi:branched-chain amino acid ABC transporter permease (plasmid) [Mesorhizobium sp. ORM8.1]